MSHDSTVTLVRELLSRMGIEVSDIAVVETPVHPLVSVSTPHSKQLIGPRGEHLRALNHLVRKMTESTEHGDEAMVLVDVNGYLKQQMEEIQQKAKLLADRVRTFKSSTEMNPMNAYERMIVHATFAEDPEITTASEGVGKERHVVLRYQEPEVEEV